MHSLYLGKRLSEDELNALIAHAHRRIEQLQKQIAEHLAMERQRLNAALETQRQEDIHLTNSAVLDERTRLKQEFEVEQQKTVGFKTSSLCNRVQFTLLHQVSKQTFIVFPYLYWVI